MTRLAAVLVAAIVTGLAETWTGYLVDSKCYEAAGRNVNQSEGSASRDTGMDVRYCRPGKKTKAFAVVPESGASLKLDAAGDAKAAEIVRGADKKSQLLVDVMGKAAKKVIEVESITLVR